MTTSTPAGRQLITPATSDFASSYEAPGARLPKAVLDRSAERSRFTNMLLPYTAKWPILHAVMTEKDSRRIFYFMSLNFFFMAIQAFYGYITDSLGLLSDSIHMFFDCVALAVGLFASVASKWPPSSRFPYGFGKVETLSGFANGVFLVLISVEIMIEAFERIVEGRETKRLAELFIVSSLGLAVNLVGMAAFGHHHHGHGHDTDTLGSGAVIVSTALTHYIPWSGWDPLASFLIAVLIIGSAIPLVKSSARRLLLTIPDEIEYSLRDTLSGITGLRGVANYSVPKFWIDDRASEDGAAGGKLMGVVHVVAVRGAEMGDVRDRVRSYFSERGIDITLQVEREGDSTCWCGVGKSPLSPLSPKPGLTQTLKAR
ncbi:putative zinc transporter msc2 [Cytospora paraplurivora]|uniref:Zinc transporter n=1 Tax=Cytospora paraplurivora TaxID=2898453 RepID=A0AAN9TY77_9PEZI